MVLVIIAYLLANLNERFLQKKRRKRETKGKKRKCMYTNGR